MLLHQVILRIFSRLRSTATRSFAAEADFPVMFKYARRRSRSQQATGGRFIFG